MRRLVVLVALAAAAWALLGRRRPRGPEATVGYEDGSAVTLAEGAPELDALVRAAREALAP